MNIKVVYHSATGNTQKLAATIANQLHVHAEAVTDNLPVFSDPVDLLFIGDGIYFGKAHKSTLAFIDRLTPGNVKYAAVFATYGGQAKIGPDMKKLLQDKGIRVIGEPYTCKGQSWAVANRNRPNEDDLKAVQQFAQDTVKEVETELC